ncbi:cytidine deaminase [uncultured Oceanisphaera sp.]|uniref:cytidine deaminase n=1 Tax=uncultured Oceanisphaera sp. TaxID=353858 RepID=UPI002621899C|nr:cytidine deaminase [uncultured Oceanisphaera sp.]
MTHEALKSSLQQHRLEHLCRFSPEQITTLLQETQLGEDTLALALLPLARQKSQVPVSGFRVGAIAIGGSGHWYLGANMETAGLPLSSALHAEQAAIGHAALFDEHHIEKVIVSASPCGHCRQFMHELNQTSLMLVLPDDHFMLAELLPHAFGPADLGQTYGMLNGPAGALGQQQKPPQTEQNLACLAAQDEANASYAPYSHNRAGVALLLDDGQLCRGRYLENAAFNPGLGPMQLALSQLFLQGYTADNIRRAFIVEAKAKVQQYDAAAQLLSRLSAVTLERLVLDTVRGEG